MERINHRLLQTGRIDKVLAEVLSVSRVQIADNIRRGNLYLNDKLIKKPSFLAQAGDLVTGSIQDDLINLAPIQSKLDILYEDEHILAVNKSQGVIVHPAISHKGETLVHYLLHYLQHDTQFSTLSPLRPGIVHRLDRGTTGVILIAKTRFCQGELMRQFKERFVHKIYECLVWGQMGEKGAFQASIGRHAIDPKRWSRFTKRARTALTDWKKLASFTHFSHIEAYPKTGRTHQIRVHLSEDGHPILGDLTYRRSGIERRHKLPPQLVTAFHELKYSFLHARLLTFTHPTTHLPMTIEAKRPLEFEKMLALLAKYDS